MTRAELINRLTNLILGVYRPHPVRVAIDGIDTAGKTTLADELAGPLRQVGREVIRASIDGFHNPREIRYRRGPDSPAGYYYDSFDYDALTTMLLKPLGPDGSREYQPAKFNFRADSPVSSEVHTAAPDAILLFDGVFLLRPELREFWDFSIFVEIEFEIALRRASARDQDLFGSTEEVRRRYLTRYLPGQRLYLEEARPVRKVDVVFHNNTPENPLIRVPGQTKQ